MQKHDICCCDPKHHKMEKFMEICLLCFLNEGQGYGYGLIEQLTLFGFSGDATNIGSLYRTLRKMELDELVTSSWEEGGQGPKRRVYEISLKGKEELKNRVDILQNRLTVITKLIRRYENNEIQKGV